jgi:hypothetical protein
VVSDEAGGLAQTELQFQACQAESRPGIPDTIPRVHVLAKEARRG